MRSWRALWLRFEIQVSKKKSRQLLSTTNSNSAKFCFSEQNLNVLWSGFFLGCDHSEQNGFLWSGIVRVVTTQNKTVFCGQEFLGCDHSEQNGFLNNFRFGTFCDVLWLGICYDGPFCGQDFFTHRTFGLGAVVHNLFV